MKINRTKYPAKKKDNYFGSNTAKKQILIANSLRKDDYHINRWQNRNLGINKDWSTYTISREGKIYEHFPVKKYSEFTGGKKVDKKVISIVLENMGYLSKVGDRYFNWLNEECNPELVGEKKYLGFQYWEIFPEVQIMSLVELLDSLCGEFKINKTLIDFKNFHKDTMNLNGIVFRSNYIYETNDINPFFVISEINEKLKTLDSKYLLEKNLKDE